MGSLSLLFAVLSFVAIAVTTEPGSCPAGTPCEEDESAFLQLGKRIAREQNIFDEAIEKIKHMVANFKHTDLCPGSVVRPLQPAQTKVLLDNGDVDTKFQGWWNMPVQQSFSKLEELKEGLQQIPWIPPAVYTWPDMRMGPAETIARRMYEGTKVSGVFEHIPKKLQGVFWMKGNGIAEELTVMQYGEHFENEDLTIVPFAPWMWAWAGGKPKHAPFGGKLYSDDVDMGMKNAYSLINWGSTISLKWDADRNIGDNDAFAYMQAAILGNLVNASNLGDLLSVASSAIPEGVISGYYALEEKNAEAGEGTEWRRIIKWGVLDCALIEFGSYDLIKIIDGDGEPVQPHYKRFLEYMGDVPLIAWAGWANGTDKEHVATQIKDYIDNHYVYGSLPSKSMPSF